MGELVRLDLTAYMRNENNPTGKKDDGKYDWGWGAGEQLAAFEFYTDPAKVKMIASHKDDDYQGEIFGIARVEDRFFLWRDSFGSCSGCDGLEDENGYEYIKDTLQEGNTRQFLTLEEAEEYINKTEDYWWKSFPPSLFTDAREAMRND